jgi:hypothetical protein
MPAVILAGLDAARRHHRLTELRAAVVGRADDTQCLEPELRIVSEQEMGQASRRLGLSAGRTGGLCTGANRL